MNAPALRVRMYETGLGDCFLLTFRARGGSRHVLIDLGTSAASAEIERERLMPIADNIARECGGRLDAIVATHWHRDHIGGFARRKRSESPGNRIASLRPSLVCQSKLDDSLGAPGDALGSQEIPAILWPYLANRSAIDHLQTLGDRREYLQRGSRTALNQMLPGMRVRVLGPAPRSARDATSLHSPAEVWRLAGELIREGRRSGALFPFAKQLDPSLSPPTTRWFLDRLRDLKEDRLTALARAINSEVNNTSLILLIDFCGHRLLFGGDAEIAAWQGALNRETVRRLLPEVTVYKASHHGSGNGTPRLLWNCLMGSARSRPLTTLLSTRGGVHGKTESRTEIPREALVEEFHRAGTLIDSRDLRPPGESRTALRFTDLVLAKGIAEASPPILKAA